MILQGIVLDENGQPFVGVAVTVPGTTDGTATGKNGDYRIMVARDCDSLRFSFVGYQPKTVSIRDARLVRMTPDVTQVEEVVVNGIFTRKAESTTGSSKTITAKELARVGNQNIIQSLKSLDASLRIFDNLASGSDPNALPGMQVRGAASFPTSGGNAGLNLKGDYAGDPNAPLFVLDGFDVTLRQVMDMDMNRVASVTILKDAAAKAIYGAKAANGVVVIETKPLLANQTRVTYNGNLTLEVPDLTSYDMCDALEKLQVEKYEGYYDSKSDNAEDRILKNQVYNRRLESALAGNSTYWLSKPLRTGVGHKHSLSVEMGENALRAIADVSYDDVQGVMKGSDRRTLGGTVNLSYRYKKIIFRNIMTLQNTRSNDSPYGTFDQYVKMNPYWSPYTEDGKIARYAAYEKYEKSGFDMQVGNPLYDATLETKLQTTDFNYINNFRIEAELSNSFKAIAQIGISGNKMDGEEFYPSEHSLFLSMTNEDDLMRRGSYEMTYGKKSAVDGRLDLQFNKTVGKHYFFANVRYQIAENKYTESTYKAEGFPSDKMTSITFARQYAEGTTPTSFESINRLINGMGFFSYSYDNRYNFEATVSENANSSFGSDQKWSTQWGTGVAWNLHNEKFMKNWERLDQFRLTASYGRTGNPNFANNNTITLYKYLTNAQYNGFIGAGLANLSNPWLEWQSMDELNVRLDFRYGPVDLSAEYYNRMTNNMVDNITVAPSTGFNTVVDNVGKVKNTGFEVNLGLTLWRGRNGFLSLSGSIVTNKNRIEELSGSMKAFNDQQMKLAAEYKNSKPVLKYTEGMPLNSIWAVPSLGIDPMTGQEIFINQKGEKTYDWSAQDMVYCGTTDPKYNGIFGLVGEFKGFGVSLAATYEGGSHLYNYTLVDRVEDIDIAYNVDRRVLTGRWLYPGQHAQYTALHDSNNQKGGMKATKPTSRFVQRNNTMKITSVSAYYEFGKRVLDALHMKRLRLAFYLNDLATFSSIQVERGTSYPFARTMSFSLTGTF